MGKVYSDRNTTLRKGDFDFEALSQDFSRVSLWNLAPTWPGRDRAKLSEEDLYGLIQKCYEHSENNACLILWMPASELHQTVFDPKDCSPWFCKGCIFSGTHPMHIGFIHTRGRCSVNQPTKLMPDARGKRGSSSSKTMKYLLKTFVPNGSGVVAEPFGHRSAQLPIWCRRLGHRYIGAVRSRSAYIEMTNRLAQEELPGIQLELPTKGRG